MGTSVVQCLDCKEWNWANVKHCEHCGSTNLTISFRELLAWARKQKDDRDKLVKS